MPDNAPAPLTPTSLEPVSFTDPVAAVDRLCEIYERNTTFLREAFARYLDGDVASRRHRAFYPEVRFRNDTYARVDSRAVLRARQRAGALQHDRHAAVAVPRLPDPPARAADPQPRRERRGGRVEGADPAALRPRGRLPARRQEPAGADPAAARRVRRARHRPRQRLHRQRHPRADARHALAARPVPGPAHRLLAAPPRALLRHPARALPELRAVHQLPVLHRRVLPPRPRADGRGRRPTTSAFVEPGNRRDAERRPNAPASGTAAAAPAADAGLPPGRRRRGAASR